MEPATMGQVAAEHDVDGRLEALPKMYEVGQNRLPAERQRSPKGSASSTVLPASIKFEHKNTATKPPSAMSYRRQARSLVRSESAHGISPRVQGANAILEHRWARAACRYRASAKAASSRHRAG